MAEEMKVIQRSIRLIDEILDLLRDAERQLKGARTWSVIDIFGGGLITDLIKHYKLNSVSGIMQKVDYKMKELQRTLGDTHIPVDYSMQSSGFLTFGDFVFDGLIFDTFMASKIFESIDEVRKLENKLEQLRERLIHM